LKVSEVPKLSVTPRVAGRVKLSNVIVLPLHFSRENLEVLTVFFWTYIADGASFC
jgi:hypothetical protein